MAVQEQRRQEFSGKYPLITFRIRREFPAQVGAGRSVRAILRPRPQRSGRPDVHNGWQHQLAVRPCPEALGEPP